MKTIEQHTDLELKAIGYDLAVQMEKIQADLRTISVELDRRAKAEANKEWPPEVPASE